LRAPEDALVVDRIVVAEGAAVKQGELLAVLSNDRHSVDGSSRRSRQRQGQEAELVALGREVEAARLEAQAQQAQISQRLAGLTVELGFIKDEVSAGQRLAASLQVQVQQMQGLMQQGFVTQQVGAQKADEVSAQESRLAASRAGLSRVQREIATLQTERSLVNARLATQLEGRQRMRAQLERDIAAAESDAGQAIFAPTEGTVSAALIAQGQSVARGQALFTITPRAQPLLLRLLVPTRVVATLHRADTFRFALHAFPPERYGYFGAKVLSVSDAPALPSDLSSLGPVSEPVYLVVATLDLASLEADKKSLPIKPGMVGEALIPLEPRSAIGWLFAPMLRHLRS
jgi:membrane fusion protein